MDTMEITAEQTGTAELSDYSRPHQALVRLTNRERQMLDALSERLDVSRSTILRWSIHNTRSCLNCRHRADLTAAQAKQNGGG